MRARAAGADEALVQREALADLPLDGVQRVEAGHRLLEDEADVVAAHVAQAAGVGREHVLAAVAHGAGDLGVLRQQPHGRERGHRLARAALADERQGLAGKELEADAAHRLGALAALDEGDAEVADVEQRLGERELAGVLHAAGSCRGAGSGRGVRRRDRCPRRAEGIKAGRKELGTHQRTDPGPLRRTHRRASMPEPTAGRGQG